MKDARRCFAFLGSEKSFLVEGVVCGKKQKKQNNPLFDQINDEDDQ
jgi:hypothetical protein